MTHRAEEFGETRHGLASGTLPRSFDPTPASASFWSIQLLFGSVLLLHPRSGLPSMTHMNIANNSDDHATYIRNDKAYFSNRRVVLLAGLSPIDPELAATARVRKIWDRAMAAKKQQLIY